MKREVIEHYDLLIDENNDPVLDAPILKEYMDKYDGDTFIDALCLNKKSKVLEIGVGTGRLALKVVNQCKEFTGIDLSSKTIERGKTYLKNDNVSLICDDFLEHKFEKNFNIIYSSLTFMHFEDKLKVLNKIYKLLHLNGRTIISINKEQNNVLDYGTRKIKVYPINKEDFINLINESNLIIEDIKEVEFSYIFVLKK